VALNRDRSPRLGRDPRGTPTSTWPDPEPSQRQLANALSSEGRVASATLILGEALTNPKTPPPSKISAGARFGIKRLLECEPRLISEDQLRAAERDHFKKLGSWFLKLLNAEDREPRHIFQFDARPVIVIRPDADSRVREKNEKYPADKFPDGEFAMLLRLPVVDNETVAPALQDPEARQYERSPNGDSAQ
jgi:hypothetical protein